MATNQTTTADQSQFTITHALGHDDSNDLFWLGSQLNLLHTHYNNHVGVSSYSHLNEWLASRMIDADEIEDHIDKLATETETQDVDGREMLEVLRFRTDLPEIKQAAVLLDEHARYTVDMKYEGAVISIKRTTDSIL